MVRIYLLDRGFSQWRWLCPKHKAAMVRDGWEVKAVGVPPHELACDDCPRTQVEGER